MPLTLLDSSWQKGINEKPGHKWDPPQLTHIFLFTRGCFKLLYLLLKKRCGHFRPGAPRSTGSRFLLPLLEWYGFRDRGSSTVCKFSPAFYLFINHFVFQLSASLLWKCPILLTLCMFGNDASHYHLIFWGSWNCAFSKQFWAESPDVTVLSEIECINLILQYIYIFLFFLPLLVKSMAVEIFMWTVSEDLCVYEIVNRADSAVIVPGFCMCSAESPVSRWRDSSFAQWLLKSLYCFYCWMQV